jgi:uncharacterized protein involved in outer membrane biogenesis
MRRFIIIAISVVVLVIAGLIAAASLINVDRFRPQVQAELQTKLNRPVEIGKLGLRIFPPAIRINDVRIGESPAFQSQQPFATAKEVYASAALFSLLRGQPELKSLRLEQPHIELIRNAQGIWNFSTLGPSGGNSNTAGSSNNQLSLRELQIIDGQINVSDVAKNRPRTTYDHIDLTLSDYAPNKKFGFKLDAHLPGQGAQQLSAKGHAGPILTENPGATPVDGHISLKQVSLAGVQRFLSGAIPEKTDSVVSGDADIRTENQHFNINGKLKLEKTTIRGVSIDYPIDADYKLDLDPVRDIVHIQTANLRLGPTPLSVSGDFDASHTPSTLNMRLNTKAAPITQLAQLAGAFGVAFNPKYKVNGDVTADLTAQGNAGKPALAGSITLNKVEVSGNELKQPVRVPQLQLALSPDEIRANPFTAESGGTHVNGSFTLTRYTSPDPMIDATLKTAGASIAELLSMAKAYGIEAADGVTGSGTLSIDVRVQGPISRPSALNYAGSGSLSNTALNLPSLSKPIEIKNANLRFQQNAASIENFAGSLASTNLRGNLSVANFSAPQLTFNLNADKLDAGELEQLSTAQGKTGANRSSGNSVLTKMSGSGSFAAGTIVSKKLVLTNVQAKCALDHGVIGLSPVTSDLYGGKQNGAITIDTRPANSAYSLKTNLTGVDVGKLLAATTTMNDTLSGSLAATTALTFVQDPSGDIARTLNGNVKFEITNGRVKNLNILNELAKVGQFVGGSPAQGGSATELKRLAGTLRITNGVAATDDLVAVLDGGSLSAKGTIDMVNQTLNLRTTAVLASNVSQTVGGNKIGGYLNTALANNKGELVIPVIVTGPIAHPNFAPDAEAMAKMKVQNLLPTTGNPTSAIQGILGNMGGKQQPSGQNQNNPDANNPKKAPSTEDTVNSIFQQLQKKGQKK